MRAAELLDLAIEWAKREYPNSLLVPELSVADWGGASIDLGIITENEVVGIEIKGKGDSPNRLELQGHVYGRVAKRMWLLPAGELLEKCLGKKPPGWGLLEVFEGSVRSYNRARKSTGQQIEVKRNGVKYSTYKMVRDESRYWPSTASELPLICPNSMCGTLWRDELVDLAGRLGVNVRGRPNVGPLTEAICQQVPAPVIHDAMIVQLRKRAWKKPIIDLRTSDDSEQAA